MPLAPWPPDSGRWRPPTFAECVMMAAPRRPL